MSNRFFFYMFLSCLFYAQEAFSQGDSNALAGLKYTYNAIRNDSLKGGNLIDANTFLNFRISKRRNSALNGQIEYASFHIQSVEEWNYALKEINLKLFWQHAYSRERKWMVFAQAGMHADFKSISGDDFLYSLGSRYTVVYNPNLAIGYGLIYARQLFGHQLNPLLFVDYKVNNRLRISGMLPIRPKISYQLTSAVTLIAEMEGSQRTFRITEGDDKGCYLRSVGWNLSSSADFLITKHHLLSLGVGYNRGTTLQIYSDADHNNWTLFTFPIGNRAEPLKKMSMKSFRLEFAYRFFLPSNKNAE
jgi:hypothetical protein